jgi:hypothetical protein
MSQLLKSMFGIASAPDELGPIIGIPFVIKKQLKFNFSFDLLSLK